MSNEEMYVEYLSARQILLVNTAIAEHRGYVRFEKGWVDNRNVIRLWNRDEPSLEEAIALMERPEWPLIFHLCPVSHDDGNRWGVWNVTSGPEDDFVSLAPTAAEAICRAFLSITDLGSK